MPDRDLSVGLGADPKDFEVPPHRPAMDHVGERNAVREMLAAERKKSAKAIQMWDETRRAELRSGNDLPIPQDKRDRCGFDRRLSYNAMFSAGTILFAVQNRKIYKGGKKQIALKEVPEKMEFPEKRYPKGEILPASERFPRAECAFMLAALDQQIVDSDPMICPVCIDFRGRSPIEMTAHWRSAHPADLDELVKGMAKIHEEEEAAMQRPLPEEYRPPVAQKQTFRSPAA